MQIAKNSVVSFHYRLFEDDQLLESTADRPDGVLYLHGHGSILAALEAEMEGRQSGDAFDITLPPEKAYGMRRQDSVERVPRKYVLTRRQPKPGDVVQVNTDHGPREVVVLKVGRFNIDVDTNHPLAGRTLRFEVEVGDVREATEEELAHGHAHGPGGHHH